MTERPPKQAWINEERTIGKGKVSTYKYIFIYLTLFHINIIRRCYSRKNVFASSKPRGIEI